ncbi:hypothetical protein [Lichenicola sp.]|uniref:hypothetical protein n=1 Tax=Lichenicola sp. TaxID=2804529 RepID=UPI003B005143
MATPGHGQAQAKPRSRLAKDGPDEISEKDTDACLEFLTYIRGPIPWMIGFAVVLSGVVAQRQGFCIILLLLVAGAGVSVSVSVSEERHARLATMSPAPAAISAGPPSWR